MSSLSELETARNHLNMAFAKLDAEAASVVDAFWVEAKSQPVFISRGCARSDKSEKGHIGYVWFKIISPKSPEGGSPGGEKNKTFIRSIAKGASGSYTLKSMGKIDPLVEALFIKYELNGLAPIRTAMLENRKIYRAINWAIKHEVNRLAAM